MIWKTIRGEAEVSVNIISNTDFIFDKIETRIMESIIPGGEFVESNNIPNFQIVHTESDSKTISMISNVIQMFSEGLYPNSSGLYDLIYSLFYRERINMNIFSVNSACVKGKNGVYLLLGKENSGKTSTVLELVENFDMKVKSGDKTLIKFNELGIQFLNGIKTMTITDVGKPFHENLLEDGIKYGERIAFVMNQDKYDVSHENITAIFLVGINSEHIIEKQLEFKTAFSVIKSYFIDIAGILFTKFKIHDMGSTSLKKKTIKYIDNNLEAVLQNLPVFKVHGNKKSMSEFIAKYDAENK